MLVPFKELLADALNGGYAVGYFEAWDMYSLEAVLAAAEAENAPVILGFGGAVCSQDWLEDRTIERLGGLGLATARAAKVPVCFILNEVMQFSMAARGVCSGFNAVMLDSGELPYDEHLRLTRQLVETAHPVGVGVEAEVGRLPDAAGGESGRATEGQLTDPEQAARFVTATGIDSLGVSIGNVHTLTEGKAEVDWDRMRAIHEAVDVPLVIHGSSGFPDDAVAKVISLGVAKFNIGVCLKQAFLDGLREAVGTAPPQASAHLLMGSRKPGDLLLAGQERMQQEVVRRIRLMRPKG